jgi:hypothetical protein
MLTLVISTPTSFQLRNQVRQTWANKTAFPEMITVFLVGDTFNESINKALLQESQKFRDIIQETFLDAYNNLTLKSVMLLKWSAKYCPSAKLFMKVDENSDVFTPHLLSYLNNYMSNQTLSHQNTFLCHARQGSPFRDPRSKYYLSYEEFKSDTFHTFCSGEIFFKCF